MLGRRKGRAEGGGKTCPCEATIAPAILDGFSCGRSDCWRTAVVQAAQDRFFAELVRRRQDDATGGDEER